MITNPVFCGLVAAVSGLYFIVTGIQYWITAYMVTVLGASPKVAAIYFIVLCFTGPIVGVIFGGILTSLCGGYNSTKGQLLQCVGGVLAVISGLPIPFCSNVNYMAIFLWLLLFFGGFIQPQVIGIMLNSVEESKRISANSLAQLSFNLIGYLPAPTFYGFIAQMVKSETSKIPMACLLFSSFLSIAALLLSVHKKLENENWDALVTSRSAAGADLEARSEANEEPSTTMTGRKFEETAHAKVADDDSPLRWEEKAPIMSDKIN